MENRIVIVWDEGVYRLHWRDFSDREIFRDAIGTDGDDDLASPIGADQAATWAANQAVLKRAGSRRDHRGWYWADVGEAVAARYAAQTEADAAANVPAWQWEARAAGWMPPSAAT